MSMGSTAIPGRYDLTVSLRTRLRIYNGSGLSHQDSRAYALPGPRTIAIVEKLSHIS